MKNGSKKMKIIDTDILLKNLEWLNEYDSYMFHSVKIAIDKTPTVDAIPIEWLKNEFIPKAKKLGATDYVDNIRFMLEDWEAWKKYRG